MGWFLVIVTAVGLAWFTWRLAKHAFGSETRDPEPVETVDIMEAAGIVEQQRFGRESWRRAEVDLPARPLSFEEQLALDSIQDAMSPNVRIT
jgi:hypothetical protein